MRLLNTTHAIFIACSWKQLSMTKKNRRASFRQMEKNSSRCSTPFGYAPFSMEPLSSDSRLTAAKCISMKRRIEVTTFCTWFMFEAPPHLFFVPVSLQPFKSLCRNQTAKACKGMGTLQGDPARTCMFLLLFFCFLFLFWEMWNCSASYWKEGWRAAEVKVEHYYG